MGRGPEIVLPSREFVRAHPFAVVRCDGEKLYFLRCAGCDRHRQPVDHVLVAQLGIRETDREAHEEPAAGCLLVGKGYAEFVQGLDVQFTDLGLVTPGWQAGQFAQGGESCPSTSA